METAQQAQKTGRYQPGATPGPGRPPAATSRRARKAAALAALDRLVALTQSADERTALHACMLVIEFAHPGMVPPELMREAP